MRIYSKLEHSSKAERERWQKFAASQHRTLSDLIRKLLDEEMARVQNGAKP